MVAIHEQVNDKSSYLRTFAARLVEERKRLCLNQAEFGQLAGVGRTTQVKYESGEGEPGAYYLARIEAMDVDLQYVLTGVRGEGSLGDEHENLLDAYIAADERTRIAVWGVLVAPYSEDARRARKEPGWFAHEVRGDEDVRYVRQVDVVPMPPPTLQDAPQGADAPGVIVQPTDDDLDVPPII